MFQPQSDCSYLMPIHFGGGKFDPDFKLTQRSTSLSLTLETDRTLLERYIPEGFELLAPRVDVVFSNLTEINWLHGGQYRLINVSAPVCFHGKRDQLDGNYTLVVWENKTGSICRPWSLRSAVPSLGHLRTVRWRWPSSQSSVLKSWRLGTGLRVIGGVNP